MIKIKPDPKTKDGPKQAAENESTKHIAENAVHGGPKDVKKDKRSGHGAGRGRRARPFRRAFSWRWIFASRP